MTLAYLKVIGSQRYGSSNTTIIWSEGRVEFKHLRDRGSRCLGGDGAHDGARGSLISRWGLPADGNNCTKINANTVIIFTNLNRASPSLYLNVPSYVY